MGTGGGVYAGWKSDFLRADDAKDNRHEDPTGHWFGFAGGYQEWQFGWPNTNPEVFADMYLGWVYNKWDIQDPHSPKDRGMERENFMDRTMTRLLVAYTDDIP